MGCPHFFVASATTQRGGYDRESHKVGRCGSSETPTMTNKMEQDDAYQRHC